MQIKIVLCQFFILERLLLFREKNCNGRATQDQVSALVIYFHWNYMPLLTALHFTFMKLKANIGRKPGHLLNPGVEKTLKFSLTRWASQFSVSCLLSTLLVHNHILNSQIVLVPVAQRDVWRALSLAMWKQWPKRKRETLCPQTGSMTGMPFKPWHVVLWGFVSTSINRSLKEWSFTRSDVCT